MKSVTDQNKWVACWGNATSITNRREAALSALALQAAWDCDETKEDKTNGKLLTKKEKKQKFEQE